ncbi:hypothetical protein ABTD73_21065, partial [Acinetobacter baumannii]
MKPLGIDVTPRRQLFGDELRERERPEGWLRAIGEEAAPGGIEGEPATEARRKWSPTGQVKRREGGGGQWLGVR